MTERRNSLGAVAGRPRAVYSIDQILGNNLQQDGECRMLSVSRGKLLNRITNLLTRGAAKGGLFVWNTCSAPTACRELRKIIERIKLVNN